MKKYLHKKLISFFLAGICFTISLIFPAGKLTAKVPNWKKGKLSSVGKKEISICYRTKRYRRSYRHRNKTKKMFNWSKMELWAIGKKGIPYRFYRRKWKKMKGSGFISIRVGSDKEIYGLKKNGRIYLLNSKKNKWLIITDNYGRNKFVKISFFDVNEDGVIAAVGRDFHYPKRRMLLIKKPVDNMWKKKRDITNTIKAIVYTKKSGMVFMNNPKRIGGVTHIHKFKGRALVPINRLNKYNSFSNFDIGSDRYMLCLSDYVVVEFKNLHYSCRWVFLNNRKRFLRQIAVLDKNCAVGIGKNGYVWFMNKDKKWKKLGRDKMVSIDIARNNNPLKKQSVKKSKTKKSAKERFKKSRKKYFECIRAFINMNDNAVRRCRKIRNRRSRNSCYNRARKKFQRQKKSCGRR